MTKLHGRFGVFFFVRTSRTRKPTSRIHGDLPAIVFGEKYQLPPKWNAVKVDPKIYDRYVGRYQKTDDPKFVITITKESNQLWNRLGDDPGAATMVLRPLSETKFFNKMFVLYEASFVADGKGQTTGLIADGPWGGMNLRRLNDNQTVTLSSQSRGPS